LRTKGLSVTGIARAKLVDAVIERLEKEGVADHPEDKLRLKQLGLIKKQLTEEKGRKTKGK
jgi:hypothetical protein